MKDKLPQPTQFLRKTHPAVWKSFRDLGEQCYRASPLVERARRLVKAGISAAAQSEGAVHSAVRHARIAGVPA
jgi:hypothetical protein